MKPPPADMAVRKEARATGDSRCRLQPKKTDRYHRHQHPRFQWFLDAYVCQALCEALHPDYLAAISQHAYEGSGCFPIEQVQRVRLGHPSGPVSLAALCSHFSMCLTRISQTVGSNSLQGS